MALWNHQQEAVEWAMPRRASLLHHGMGSGKSLTALTVILNDLERTGLLLGLICCPKAVIAAWRKQAGMWAKTVRFLALDKGSSTDKEKAIKAAISDKTPLLICGNYESVYRIKSLEKLHLTHIVWDEVHRLKSPSGVTSRWAGRMCQKHPDARILGLTGTLIPHSVLDLWGIYRAMEAPLCPTFGPSYTLHKAAFAVLGGGQQKFVVGYRNLPAAHAKVRETTHHVRSCDVLDLPPISFDDVQCELTPDEAKVYVELERDFCAVIARGSVTPQNALEQLLRMAQVCGGAVRFDGDTAATEIAPHPAKRTVLADMLEDLPASEPVVIFCRFSSDIANAKQAAINCGRSVSELSGARNELAGWQQGTTTTLVTQIQSGGIGIDLTRAAYCWFYSLGYSLAEYEQAVARLHRPGQTKHTTIYHLVATVKGRQTVDGRVYEALRERRTVVDDIIRGYGAANRAI